MKALVTGFDAFGGALSNPAEGVVRRLARNSPDDSFEQFAFLVVPTVYERSSAVVRRALDTEKPDVIIMLGLADDARTLQLERFAINICDCRHPDNDGDIRVGVPVITGGVSGYQTNVDIAALTSAMLGSEFVPEPSNYAGTFVCNCLYYVVLDHISKWSLHTKALFVHVPWNYRSFSADSLELPPLLMHERAVRRLLIGLRSIMK